MADEVYEVYIRDVEGECKDMPFREGLAQFLSNDGYRLSINIEGVTIVLRKDIRLDSDRIFLDTQLNEISVDAMVTVKGIK